MPAAGSIDPPPISLAHSKRARTKGKARTSQRLEDGAEQADVPRQGHGAPADAPALPENVGGSPPDETSALDSGEEGVTDARAPAEGGDSTTGALAYEASEPAATDDPSRDDSPASHVATPQVSVLGKRALLFQLMERYLQFIERAAQHGKTPDEKIKLAFAFAAAPAVGVGVPVALALAMAVVIATMVTGNMSVLASVVILAIATMAGGALFYFRSRLRRRRRTETRSSRQGKREAAAP